LKLIFSFNEDRRIVSDFKKQVDFSSCGGAIDGKHIQIVKSARSGSCFYNYKDYCSIVLLAVVNVDYSFSRRTSDGGVIVNTTFVIN
jgi:hypothetical protein